MSTVFSCLGQILLKEEMGMVTVISDTRGYSTSESGKSPEGFGFEDSGDWHLKFGNVVGGKSKTLTLNY